ncbi:site-specific DNA-methyltransferase [Leptolyngbya sp. 7M]|uniref:site-specific DNA-methyltransferase n=1 Tax=Leptolyngbya sp. 7M TaxID=2812896 RepID=UPI001CEC52B7|nr:site-specific DNA-methyltransferase [Leptolyngbya sp. 7M]
MLLSKSFRLKSFRLKVFQPKVFRPKVSPKSQPKKSAQRTAPDADQGGSIPPNVIDDDTPSDLLKFGNNAANDPYTLRCKEAGIKIHPARFPAVLPEFFIKLLTDYDDVVVDPFAGSNTTGMVAEALERRWLAFELDQTYLEASKFRFDSVAR